MALPLGVVEHLGFYVYALRDPRDGAVFYVGKGTGNRLFAHVAAAIERPAITEKLDRIRAIHAAGREVDYEVIRHGLTEDQAFEVESALIDWLGLDDLANAVGGHHAARRGRMTVPEIVALYAAQPVTLTEPCLLIIVNRRFARNTGAEQLYEITRGDWVVGPRRAKARFALSVFRGLVRAVYRIEQWEPVVSDGPHQKRRNRWRFVGTRAAELQHLVGGDVSAYLGQASQNPVRYVNC
ncbi:MAG: hypothetical protein KDE27_03010 [Planctomycetes bacterium]|nr:hypothetical protein [Planctomycetota bacterium]